LGFEILAPEKSLPLERYVKFLVQKGASSGNTDTMMFAVNARAGKRSCKNDP
jgi:hypothetical protein